MIAFFQIVVLKQPLPQMGEVLFGALLVVSGLTLFIQGLEMGLFPIGESMAHALARKGSLFWLLAFASLFPIIAVMGYAQIMHKLAQRKTKLMGEKNAL